MIGKKLIAAGAVALAGLSVGGAAIAAGNGSDVTGTPATVESSSGDTDTLQEGDQTSADAPSEPNEAEEANEAEEPGDENLPGGGHSDPEGQDVNHEFEGVE